MHLSTIFFAVLLLASGLLIVTTQHNTTKDAKYLAHAQLLNIIKNCFRVFVVKQKEKLSDIYLHLHILKMGCIPRR